MILKTLTILFLLTIPCQCSLSGLYMSNGLDQTMIQRVMSTEEKILLEHEILDLLGLPTRPKKRHHIPIKKSAPKFLLDVYKSIAEEENSRETRSSDMSSLSGEDLIAIDESDVIVTFQSRRELQI